MKSGIINVNKEAGYTSFDVVAKLRGILGIRKIGHTGTLDPDATGVLPVCIGKATKVCDLLTDKDKTYVAVMRLGITTDTQDMSGKVLKESPVQASEEEVLQAIMSFVGPLQQVPPMYSALKVDGKKLCDLARQGITVERKARDITIYKIDVLEMNLPYVKMEVTCSKGTYIRTLCHDIGEKLGCGACMDSLIRTQVSAFTLENSFSLAEIQKRKENGTIEEILLSVDAVFDKVPKAVAIEEATAKLSNGNTIYETEVDEMPKDLQEGDWVRMYMQDGRFVGIFYWKEHQFKPEKMFLE